MESVSNRRPLTEKQKAIYSFIKQEITGERLSPTVHEIAEQFGIRSSNGVMCHLRALERKGWISRDHYLSRGITLIGEPVVKSVFVESGEELTIGEVCIRCVGVGFGKAELEIIAPDTMGEVTKECLTN